MPDIGDSWVIPPWTKEEEEEYLAMTKLESGKKITILDIINNHEEESVWFAVAFLVFIFAISTIYINISSNDLETELAMKMKSNRDNVIAKIVEMGYTPLVAGCAVDNSGNACTILSARVDIKDIEVLVSE